MLDPVTVIQHAVPGNADAVAAQPVHTVTLDDFAKLEINIGLGVIASGLHLFGQRTL